MNCVEVNQHFEAALDEALEPEMEKALMLHIRTCSSCQVRWDEMQALRSALQKSSLPAPSAYLDKRVMEAFNRSHRPRHVAPQWWQRLVFGSISVPKPIFAAILIAFALALTLAAQIGRLTATTVSVASLPPMVEHVSVPQSPQIVYVPVKGGQDKRPQSLNDSKRLPRERRTVPSQSPKQIKSQPLESFTLISAEGANYTTRATLKGFEPLQSATVRVIKGRGE